MVQQDLFDFIAGTLASFVDTEDESLKAHFAQSGKVRESGFAFSFPVRQTSVKSGIVIHWTKGFKVDDAVRCTSRPSFPRLCAFAAFRRIR